MCAVRFFYDSAMDFKASGSGRGPSSPRDCRIGARPGPLVGRRDQVGLRQIAMWSKPSSWRCRGARAFL